MVGIFLRMKKKKKKRKKRAKKILSTGRNFERFMILKWNAELIMKTDKRDDCNPTGNGECEGNFNYKNESAIYRDSDNGCIKYELFV